MILNFWIWLLNFCKTFVVEFRIIFISESESSVSIGFGIISYPSVANIYWNVHQLSIFRTEQFLLAFLVGGKKKKIWFFWLSTPAGRVWKHKMLMSPHKHIFPHFRYENEQYVNFKAITKQNDLRYLWQWEIYGKDSLKAIEKIKDNVMIIDVAEAMLTCLVSLFNIGKSQFTSINLDLHKCK